MNPYRSQVTGAIRATEITSSSGFAWFGKPLLPLPPRLREALSAEALRGYLALQLGRRLYSDFYCRGFAVRVESVRGQEEASAEFVASLSEANCGVGTWDPGWKKQDAAGAAPVVEKGGLRLFVNPEECRASPAGGDYHECCVDLFLPKEMLGISPGFYVAVGNSPLGDSGSELIRIYWNTTPAGAIRLVRDATRVLNGAEIPFKLKSLNNPDAFHRCDCVVLYLQKSDYENAMAVTRAIYRGVAPSLKPGVPALTKLLAPGVGLAEGPPGGESFGMSRCAIIAEGLIQAQGAGEGECEGILEVIERGFRSRGVNLEEPFLNAGSRDSYSWPVEPVRSVAASSPGKPPEPRAESSYRETALSIGLRLCSQAVWQGAYCNWIGPVPEFGDHRTGTWEKSAALGPDVYSGTSGIALFLAELNGRVDDTTIRRTALGAMRQAIANAEHITPSRRIGFYCGWTGIALSAARVGMLLGEDSLTKDGGKMVRRFATARNLSPSFDVISGYAGAVPALLTLGGHLEEKACLDLAVLMGNRLLRTAQRSPEGWSWKSETERRNLTGLSHGAAGVGRALLELFHATGQRQYRDAAMEAFRYERSWYSPEEGNWRDLRSLRYLGRSRGKSFAMTWCHGAPGIALTRLRAFQITGEDQLRCEAEVALRATRLAVDSEVALGGGNDSLCHGAMGNADILLCGDDVLQTRNLGRDSSLRVGEAISREWSTTVREDEMGPAARPHGLMLGTAGAGYFLLRIIDPTVPSILSLGKELLFTSNRGQISRPARHRSVS